MFETFLAYSCNEIDQLNPLLKKEELINARKLAHKLKPTFPMVGLLDIHDKILEIESKLDAKAPITDIKNLVSRIEKEMIYWKPILQNELDRLNDFLTKSP